MVQYLWEMIESEKANNKDKETQWWEEDKSIGDRIGTVKIRKGKNDKSENWQSLDSASVCPSSIQYNKWWGVCSRVCGHMWEENSS